MPHSVIPYEGRTTALKAPWSSDASDGKSPPAALHIIRMCVSREATIPLGREERIAWWTVGAA